MKKAYRNVSEQWLEYDTVGVFDTTLVSSYNITNPNGWFQNLAAMGAVNKIDFFNVRNRNIGLAYNNQDSRDLMPYAFRAHSLGVSFFCHSMTQAPNYAQDDTFSPEDSVNHVFCVDLPRHTSVTLKVQQDERLKSHAYFCPPGYGPCGSGFGRGAPSARDGGNNGIDHTASVISQGEPSLANRWQFPVPLEIPRRAALSVTLEFNEYARTLLQNMPDENEWFGVDAGDDVNGWPVFFGIQLSIGGERLVQQRGQYHV